MSGREYVRTRNIGIMAHIDAGKTTEYYTILELITKSVILMKVRRLWTGWSKEQERGIAITSKSSYNLRTHSKHGKVSKEKSKDLGCRINIIDTPGSVDFTVEVERSLSLDGAVGVFCAKGGRTSIRKCMETSRSYNVPRMAFINKMDILGADFYNAVQMIKDRLGKNAVPITIADW